VAPGTPVPGITTVRLAVSQEISSRDQSAQPPKISWTADQRRMIFMGRDGLELGYGDGQKMPWRAGTMPYFRRIVYASIGDLRA
jgi:hypothetical protein